MCTRILWNTSQHAVLAGRTMDWPESTEPVLTVFPRGLERNGGLLGSTTVVGDNPLLWSSRWGSLVTTVYGAGTADGLNEAGLAAHMLYLDGTDLGPRDPGRPGLQIALWIQYLLDGAGTVREALDLLDTCQLVPVEMRGFAATVHVALEDASGDSAVIEYLAGRRRVHHDRSYTIMTNEPAYDEQLRLLREQVRRVRGLGHDEPSSEVPLPGNVNAVDRFQRAAYFSALLPEPADDRQAVAGILAVTRNASVPFGAP
ncbi:linear amide C-N hydrolase [Streptomyces sp. NPDC056491]|uniref:linear amide C-N hydrolase n=1 Tax=Streptomyces sp. NPDC056491 TaxID=3345837 RepID=UPI0036B2730B